MAINILVFLFLYLSASFILTALYVRFRGEDHLAVYYRKKFALFPSFPVIMLLRLGLFPFRLLAWRGRDLFEYLSGKPTYHRRKINYYGRRQKLRHRKDQPDSAAQTGGNISPEPPSRAGLVSDNDAMLPAVTKVVSKY